MGAMDRLRLDPSAWTLIALGLVLAGSGTSIQAQDAAGPATTSRSSEVSASFMASQTFTDNGAQRGGERRSDAITRLGPQLRWRSAAGRLQGHADYALTGVVYANGSHRNELQNELRARASWMAIDPQLRVDMSGHVSRQAISAFGPTSPGLGEGVRGNQTEVASFSVAPTWRGQLGAVADVEARWRFTRTRTDSDGGVDITGNADDYLLDVRFLDPVPQRRLSWMVDASRQRFDPEDGRTTEIDRVNGTLSLRLGDTWVLRGMAGWESNNFTDLKKQGRSTYGAGLDWRPSVRTMFSLDAERRFFGHAHHLNFQHRMRRFVIRISDTRDMATNASRFAVGLGTVYDLFFLQFASIEPDPVRRDELVRAFLQANGISPTAVVTGSFLSSGVSVDRRQQISLAWQGARNSAAFSLSRTRSERLDTLSTPTDDFANANQIDQRGATLSFSHRLTPASSATLGLSWIRSRGRQDGVAGAAGLYSRQRSVDLGWAHRLGRRSHLSVVYRHLTFDGRSNPFDENAITATFTMQF